MVNILCMDLSSADEKVYAQLYGKASPERRLRADRYPRQEDRLRCVASGTLLEYVLGTADYQTETNGHGKPRLKDRPGFHYNISHSGRFVAIAWGDSEVGLDVQRHKRADLDALAARWFTPQEQAYIQGSCQRFYEIWTGKESYLKYMGTGLSGDMRSFSVLDPAPGLFYHYRLLEGDYSLSLCCADPQIRFRLLDIRQLLR